MNEPGRNSKGEWYFAHVLAWLAFLTLAVLLAARIYLEAAGVKVVEFPAVARVILGAGVFATIWFWIRMLVDYFRQRPPRHPVLWGWALFLGMVVAALPYFWLVWRPRHRPAET
jgi:hypothetical protein